jgi:anti-sigma factor RsiW
MGKAEDERLQRYFDGEMPAEERARVEATLTDDDRLKLAALAEMRGLVANALLAEAAEIDLLPGIEAALVGGGGIGLGLGKAEAKARRRWGLMAHPAGWSSGVLAAAAAVLLLVFQPWHSAHAQNGCDIESLDTYGAVVTVFRMSDSPHNTDESTTVIFTEEDD